MKSKKEGICSVADPGPGSGIRYPGSGIRYPGSGIRDPVSGIRYPESGAFITPGSGIGFFRISGPRSRIINLYFRELNDNFLVKITIILCQLAKILSCTPVEKLNNSCFVTIVVYKRLDNKFSPLLFCCCFLDRGSEIGVPEWIKKDEHPGSAKLILCHFFPDQLCSLLAYMMM